MRFPATAAYWLVILVTGRHWCEAASATHKSRQRNLASGDGDDRRHRKAPAFDWDGASGGVGDEPRTRITDVTTSLGQTAFLHCRVRELGDRRVLWMRQRDLHILTSALHTYTNDWRISALHSDARRGPGGVAAPERNGTRPGDDDDDDDGGGGGVWSEWTLRIRSTEARDAGLYECQVSSEPKISKIYRLHVAASKASILASAELFVKKGSDINLTCVTLADDEPGDRPQLAAGPVAPGNRIAPLSFAWLHNGQVLDYSARGGLSVTTDTISGHSRLLLARADPRDSGNYTCAPGPGATSASVAVHVLNGEQPAAMQRDNSAGVVSPWRWWSTPHSTVALSISVCSWHRVLNRLADVT